MEKDLTKKTEMVEIGKITGAHGIRGEVRVFAHSGSADNLRKGMEITLRDAAGRTSSHRVGKAGMHGRVVLLKLDGTDDRNAAEALTGRTILIDESELAELPEDTYYLRDLEGMAVFDAATGEETGVLTEVIQGPAQDVYRIRRPDGKEALVPAVKEFIKEIDTGSGRITIRFIDGMF